MVFLLRTLEVSSYLPFAVLDLSSNPNEHSKRKRTAMLASAICGPKYLRYSRIDCHERFSRPFSRLI